MAKKKQRIFSTLFHEYISIKAIILLLLFCDRFWFGLPIPKEISILFIFILVQLPGGDAGPFMACYTVNSTCKKNV